MRWEKDKQHPEYYAKNFYIIEKCTEEEKKIYGVNFKNAYETKYEILVLKLKDCTPSSQNIYCVLNDCNNIHRIIGTNHYFKSFRKAKKFVENKVKEYNKKGGITL